MMYTLAWLQLVTSSTLIGLTMWLLHDARHDWLAIRKNYLEGSPVYKQARGAMHLTRWRIANAMFLFVIGVIMMTVTPPVHNASWVGRLAIVLVTSVQLAMVLTDYLTRMRVNDSFEALGPEQFITMKVIEALPDGLIVINKRGIMKLVNTSCEVMFGYRRHELLGKSVDMLLEPTAQLDRHIKGPMTKSSVHAVVARRKDGTNVVVDINLSALPTSYGLYTVALARIPQGSV